MTECQYIDHLKGEIAMLRAELATHCGRSKGEAMNRCPDWYFCCGADDGFDELEWLEQELADVLASP